ncbi:DUF1127 domain-containing protein [Pseudorhodobacter sp. E13]|uniref:DUF1127 domain-containing protein n=1 Tax=Pseudorhodobacter sp. E13 TaxID=2487931 RepID=UPI001F1B65BF|nr:DUF1127 domain-containing protein [Pseudorhodobacter sp. E13]
MLTTSAKTCTVPPMPQPGFLPRLRALFALRRERRALAKLPGERLRDIGLTAQQAQAESQRRLWDVPPHWTRLRR